VQKKTKKKRKKRAAIPKISDIDDFYKYVNKVQLDKNTVVLTITDSNLVPIIENILRDSSLEFDKREFSTGFRYRMYPNFDEVVVDIDIDELQDEFLEEGQLF